MQNRGQVANSGTFLVGSTATFSFFKGTVSGDPIVRSGTLMFPPGAQPKNNTSAVVVEALSSLVGDVPANFTVTVQGSAAAGDANLTAGSIFTNNGTITLTTSGGGFNATLTTPGFTNAGKIRPLAGAGGPRTINGDVVNLGTIDLSTAVLQLSVNGNITNDATGTVAILIGANVSSSQLVVSTDSLLGGRLVLFTGYTPSAGDIETILTTATSSGTFATIIGNDPPGPVTSWNVTYNPGSVTLLAS